MLSKRKRRFYYAVWDTEGTQKGRVWGLLMDGEARTINELFSAICLNLKAEKRQRDPRTRQQRVGAVINQINEAIADEGFRIVPGEARATYVLART